ncbi:uncharacterized protein LOC116214245 [Punica granatum]|uniref:Uncharacterized protein LOC116214245 n=2 Tax=Punica granatum TaxID=22663 RepID=A0A6P8EJF7_PUNGR|nr:uncharacterized protein LOC116214245 [Punica granatum]XP_031405481.1 uncharacterized protein LOC116214245 [Punica granatum]PKI68049.1 hypothetical protein CRG98_011645 [Punica granatum]
MAEHPEPPAAQPSSPTPDGADRSPSAPADPPTPPLLAFDPSRMIGIIRRKAMVKDLAAAYHAECLASCQELSELQKKWDEPYIELKPPEENRKEPSRHSKRQKKSR